MYHWEGKGALIMGEASQAVLVAKKPPANAGDVRVRLCFLGWEDPWRRAWQPTPVFWPRNPMDRGAWRTTVHGITKSWTRLK